MLCSQMIAKQNLTVPSAYASLFAHTSPLPNHNSGLFCGLRTLFPLLSREISRNPSRINHFRTLHKTTEGCGFRKVQTLPHADLPTSLTPLESALTKNRKKNRTKNT